MNYLKPGKTYRPHLDDWNHATPESIDAVARSYQARYEKFFKDWSKALASWRAGGRTAKRPDFEAETDGFFFDVYIQRSGPMAASRDQEAEFTPEAREQLKVLRARQEEMQKTSPPEPDMASAVQEGEPIDQKVFIRGDYGNHGEAAPKAVPVMLASYGRPAQNFRGSGRLQLAEWITSPDNPLPARVMANRIWQWHFGEGLVRTPDNFGRMGERPTNPYLLDYLARRFIDSGWSLKAMHRMILVSSAWQMSSEAEVKTLAADPENRLLSRFQRRRLQIEEIRDGMLAIDASLDLTMGGSLQKGTGTDSENSQDRLSIRFDKQTRRTVYLPLRRANLPSLLNLFDFGDATTASGKRMNTNVAPQALFMLNSEFLDDRSSAVAKSLAGPAAARVESAWLRILNRRPSSQDTAAALRYVDGFRSSFPASGEIDAWRSYVRVLLASNDFMFLD